MVPVGRPFPVGVWGPYLVCTSIHMPTPTEESGYLKRMACWEVAFPVIIRFLGLNQCRCLEPYLSFVGEGSWSYPLVPSRGEVGR